MLTSCATLVNQSTKIVTIHTTEPSKIIYKQDTVETENNKTHLKVERKKEVLSIVAKTDSISKTILLEPKNSFMFWFNIPSNYALGMLIDMKNPKRYSYPGKIYLNSEDSINRYCKYGKIDNKGELYLHLSLPHVNSFYLKPMNEGQKINTGFWGLSFGLDYYYSKNQFINLGVSGVMDFFMPLPAAVDIAGEHESMESIYIYLSNNHKIQRFSMGYGLSFARNTWNFNDYGKDPKYEIMAN